MSDEAIRRAVNEALRTNRGVDLVASLLDEAKQFTREELHRVREATNRAYGRSTLAHVARVPIPGNELPHCWIVQRTGPPQQQQTRPLLRTQCGRRTPYPAAQLLQAWIHQPALAGQCSQCSRAGLRAGQQLVTVGELYDLAGQRPE